MLAVLAAAGERGRSRDQLQGMFWSEVPQARGRRSLDQLLYALRGSLDPEVFSGSNPLKLNAAVVSSDMGLFSDALLRSDFEGAVGLYGGPFLDGFYLTGAPEFEQWMESERRLIERQFTDALERLADQAASANDAPGAVRWRQRLVDNDPVSSKHAIGLIRSLAEAGDHAAALVFAERHEIIVREQLGTSVGPDVAALVAEVRDGAVTESVVLRGATGPARVSGKSAMEPSRPVTGADIDATPVYPGANKIPKRLAGRRAFAYGLAAIGFVSVLLIAWLTGGGNEVPVAAGSSSIAVLPLANVSGDASDAALVDGLSEEMIGVLARIDGLRVVARTSAFGFRGSSLDVRQIADSLKVNNILEGSVQRNGQRLRVQVRLVDARDATTRWSETYDRDLEDIFVVQSDIANSVARELHLRLGSGAASALRRAPTRNIAAYELYLRGTDPALLRSDSSANRALAYFTKAASIDSTYASAYAGMARMYLRLRESDLAGTSARRNHEMARAAALKSVALDDSLAEAHAALGLVHMNAARFRLAETELRRAVALDPHHSRTREWLAHLHYWNERPAEALLEANRALENDPLSPSAHAEVARALCANGQVPEGLRKLKTLESLQPPLGRVELYVALCHEAARNWSAAAASLRQSSAPMTRALLAHALARDGRRDEALVVLSQLTNRLHRTTNGSFFLAVVHGGLGDRDEAFRWLDRSVENFSMAPQLVQPLLDDLRGDPRLAQFRQRVGLQNR